MTRAYAHAYVCLPVLSWWCQPLGLSTCGLVLCFQVGRESRLRARPVLRTSRLARFNEQHSKLRSKGEYALMNEPEGALEFVVP